ncbi:chorismate synthase [Halorutilales archaeon Cl-col2-1]
MNGNSFGDEFKITTWGESHGEAIGVVVDGCPAGIELSEEEIQKDLDRRKPGQSDVSTSRGEADKVEILSGVFDGETQGTPISMIIWNKDSDSSKYEDFITKPRPGHADFTYEAKHGTRDWRGGGRSSARETACRVAAAGIAKKILDDKGIQIKAHVNQIGDVRAEASFEEIIENSESNDVRCADPDKADEMQDLILDYKESGDSIGGSVECYATGVPKGLGEPIYDKFESVLAKAMMSINASTAFEIGVGKRVTEMTGYELNDEWVYEDDEIVTETNNAGGVLGGITNGMPVRCEVSFRAPSSIPKEQHTVDWETGEDDVPISVTGRHDPVIPPRAVPVVEAMMALVTVDFLIRAGEVHPDRLGGRKQVGD